MLQLSQKDSLEHATEETKHGWTHTHTCRYMQTYMHTYMCTHMHIHTGTHMHTHKHTHTCVWVWGYVCCLIDLFKWSEAEEFQSVGCRDTSAYKLHMSAWGDPVDVYVRSIQASVYGWKHRRLWGPISLTLYLIKTGEAQTSHLQNTSLAGSLLSFHFLIYPGSQLTG